MKKILLLMCMSMGQLAFALTIPEGYKLETVTLPKGATTLLGVCKKDAETMAVCTWEGEVWEYKNGTWSLFAENLMEPNGIYYDTKEGAYYVAQKPELTRLHDNNKDGKADVYESYCAKFGWSGSYHEYHFGPVVDSMGRKYATLNLAARPGETGIEVRDGRPGQHGIMCYTAPYRGWVYRTDRPGHFQPIATGLRSPCGIGMSPQDELFITDNQGDWLADCALFHIREGRFYGHPAGLEGRADFTREKLLSWTAADFDKIRTRPVMWLPRTVISNSPGSPAWDTEGKFSNFPADQFFIGDQTQSNLIRCGIEKVGGEYQGWCVEFLRGTKSGTVKMDFDSKGRLWTAQVGRGWLSKGGSRTALQYVEWDGKTTPFAIENVNLTKKGFKISFTEAINEGVTPVINSWGYHYWSTYGSDQINTATHAVTNATLSADGKVLEFECSLEKEKVVELAFAGLVSKSGKALLNTSAYYTVNNLLTEPQPRPSNRDLIPGTGWHRIDKDRPQPIVVSPLPAEKSNLPPPEGALVLDESQWTNPNWKTNEPGVFKRSKGNMSSKEAFGSSRIHIEFKIAKTDDPTVTGQLYGNSGIFLMSGYELQVMNGYENPTTADGICGAIWGQYPPRVNASRAPGEWQSYDILMKAPEFNDDGSVKEPLRLTVFHNGVLIHDDVSCLGKVNKPYEPHGALPLMIQDHKGSDVFFRNMWIFPSIDYDTSLDAFRYSFEAPPAVVARPPQISILDRGMVGLIDKNGDEVITEQEFLGFWKDQFEPSDINNDGKLTVEEFGAPAAMEGADKDKDGFLTPEEHISVYIPQFPGLDINKDGVIDARDKKPEPKKNAVNPAAKKPAPKGKLIVKLKAGEKLNIVTFGTSLTKVGAWVDQFRVLLEQQFPGQTKVFNGAQGGANSDWGVSAIDKKVLAHDPDVVFIEFSVNDAVASRATDLKKAERNLRHLINLIRIQNKNCEIILQVMNPAVGYTGRNRPDLLKYNEMYREVAKHRDLQLIDHYPQWEKLLNEDPAQFLAYVPDCIHPAREGALAVITPHLIRELGLAQGDASKSIDAPMWKYFFHLCNTIEKDDLTSKAEYEAFWQRHFEMQDENKNGELSKDEYIPESIFNVVDANRDGKILIDEYQQFNHLHFKIRDADKNGSLDEAERKKPLSL